MSKNFQEFFLFMDTWARNYGYMSKKFFCSCWYGRRRKKTYIPWEGGGLVRGQGHNLVISARCALFPTPSHNRCHFPWEGGGLVRGSRGITLSLVPVAHFSQPLRIIDATWATFAYFLYHMSKLVYTTWASWFFFYTTCAIPHEQECCSCSFLIRGSALSVLKK